MKSTSCFLAACIVCSVLPSIVQGAELLDRDGGGGGGGGGKPKAQNRSIRPPVIIEIEDGLINLLFTRNWGEVTAELQQMAGITTISQVINTSEQNQASLIVPTGTYILTIIASDGTILAAENIIIP